MAKSKLAAQLEEAAGIAAALNQEAARFGQLKNNFAADLSFGDGGGAGGAGGPILGPDGSPASGRPGRAAGQTIRSSDSIVSEGTTLSDGIDVGAEEERLAELRAACRHFAIPYPVMLRASRAAQDRLLAKFRALGRPGYEAGFATQGSGTTSGATGGDSFSRLPPDITGGAAGQAAAAYSPLRTQPQRSEAPGTSTANTAATAAAAKATVSALGSVVTELKKLNENVARKSTGVEFRTGGIG